MIIARIRGMTLQAISSRSLPSEGRRFALPAPFMVVATQNPIEQEGTYPLPEAQLDRFLVKVVIGYPTLEDEKRMVAGVVDGKVAADLDVSRVRSVLGQAELLAVQQGVAAIRMDPAWTDYAVRIVRTTREWPGVIAGAGPRGGLALARLARAQAVVDGRDFRSEEHTSELQSPLNLV